VRTGRTVVQSFSYLNSPQKVMGFLYLKINNSEKILLEENGEQPTTGVRVG
jgi:hypothetical protein